MCVSLICILETNPMMTLKIMVCLHWMSDSRTTASTFSERLDLSDV